MEERTVTIGLDEYNRMRDEIAYLERTNKELAEIVEKVKDMDNTRVIIKEITTFTDDDGFECTDTLYSIKNFNDVKEEVRSMMKKDIEESIEKVEELKKGCEERSNVLEELKEITLEAQANLAELENRNWWQRLLNK